MIAGKEFVELAKTQARPTKSLDKWAGSVGAFFLMASVNPETFSKEEIVNMIQKFTLLMPNKTVLDAVALNAEAIEFAKLIVELPQEQQSAIMDSISLN